MSAKVPMTPTKLLLSMMTAALVYRNFKLPNVLIDVKKDVGKLSSPDIAITSQSIHNAVNASISSQSIHNAVNASISSQSNHNAVNASISSQSIHTAVNVLNTTIHPKIAHLYPVYRPKDCAAPFCPYDQDQSIAIASMRRARDYSKNAHVVHTSSVFPEDANIVPDGFIQLANLTRSTSSEFPGAGSKVLPLYQEMFDNLRASPDFHSYDYIIYTNSDIILHEEFYDTLAAIIKSKRFDSFVINRQTVGKTKPGTKELYTASDLSDIYRRTGRNHPGTDCFIITRSVFERIDMKSFFLGNDFSANYLLFQVQNLANKFKMFQSNSLKRTYHLGDDRNWQKSKSLQKISYDLACRKETIDDVMRVCRFGSSGCFPDLKQIQQLRYLGRAEFAKRKSCTLSCFRFAEKLTRYSRKYLECQTCNWNSDSCPNVTVSNLG